MGERSCEHAADLVFGAESSDVCMVLTVKGDCWADGQNIGLYDI
jgi:hypothetical protein